jgi:Icc-related predicted phosphoesterase
LIIAAVSDVHSPRWYQEFVHALDRLRVKPDIFVIAGDMIERGAVGEYERVYNALFGKINCHIVACFGNNEFDNLRQQLKAKFPDIKFLDDEGTILRLGNITVGVVGTTGSLDNPTPWQKENVPGIEKTFQERVNLVERMMKRMGGVDFRILVSHYAPTYKTLEGENPRFYGSMGSKMYEGVIQTLRPTVVFHGHSVRGKKMDWVDTVPVYNVAFAVNREIVVVDTDKDLKAGITRFV